MTMLRCPNCMRLVVAWPKEPPENCKGIAPCACGECQRHRRAAIASQQTSDTQRFDMTPMNGEYVIPESR